MDKKLYGIDSKKELTALDIRTALCSCFKQAHKDAFAKTRKIGKLTNKKEYESYENSFINMLMRDFFKNTGGDYDSPDKKSLMKVIPPLGKFAKHFRSKEIVDGHMSDFKTLISELK